MKNGKTLSFSKSQVTLLTCLAVAFGIAFGSLCVGALLGGANNPPNQQDLIPDKSEEVTNEKAQGSAIHLPSAATDSGDTAALVATGLDEGGIQLTDTSRGSGDNYCVLVAVTGDNSLNTEAANGNAIRVPISVCAAVSVTLIEMIQNGDINPRDILYQPYDKM